MWRKSKKYDFLLKKVANRYFVIFGLPISKKIIFRNLKIFVNPYLRELFPFILKSFNTRYIWFILGVSFVTTGFELRALCFLSKIERQYVTAVIYKLYMPPLTLQQRIARVPLFYESELPFTVGLREIRIKLNRMKRLQS